MLDVLLQPGVNRVFSADAAADRKREWIANPPFITVSQSLNDINHALGGCLCCVLYRYLVAVPLLSS